jgi:hypothetical protein
LGIDKMRSYQKRMKEKYNIISSYEGRK